MVGAKILFILVLYVILHKDYALLVTCSNNMGKREESSCNGERCYRNGTHIGCMDTSSCVRLTNADNCQKVQFPCCCRKNWCNDVKSTNKNSIHMFWPHFAILILGGSAFVAYITFRLIRRKLKLKKKKEDRTSHRPTPEKPRKIHNEEHSTTRYGEDLDYYSEPLSYRNNFIDHVDLTNMKIEAIIDPEVKEKILLCLRHGTRPLKAHRRFAKSPKIVKVATYGTSDHITLLESPESTNLSKRQGSLEHASGHQAAEDLLLLLIENGPREFHFDTTQLQEVLRIGAEIFLAEDSLLEVPVPCTIYGDTHGQYSDLLRWFNLNGWPHEERTVFLGDFVDRGSHGVELFTLITCLKVCFPDNIFLIRGNHEEESLNQIYSFVNEVHLKFNASHPNTRDGPEIIYNSFKNVFMNLPLACLIGGDILAMHGGISPMLKSLKDIQEIKRPIDEFVKGTLACDLVWSDPDTLNHVEKYEPNFERESTVGIGQLFSKSAVKETCRRLGIKMIIRGHQAPLHGYATWAGGRLVTLFSAPAYKGSSEETMNLGACIQALETGELTIKQLKVSETVRKKREDDAVTRSQVRANLLGVPQSEFVDSLPVSHTSNLAIEKSQNYEH